MISKMFISLTVVGLLHVYVNALTSRADGNSLGTQEWTRDSSIDTIDTILASPTIIYCKIEDPSAHVFFERFGPCRIVVPRVLDAHHGIWKVSVGYRDKITLEEHKLMVNVVTTSTKPTVTTSVVKQNPVVTLTCSLPAQIEVKVCKFRDPSGKVLVTTKNAVTEDRYTVPSDDNTSSCTLQITTPVTSDLGLWRCGMETELDTFYGFLTVLCPWAMQDPTVAASVITEPVLSSQTTAVSAVVGDDVTLMCSVPSSIRYCFFRSRNGTIFNVGTELYSRNAQYYGSGLESGECGIRFAADLTDAGMWSCHVGFTNANMEEQRVSIQLEVNDLMVAEQYNSGSTLVVESKVHNSRPLDYCRFVRIDGHGFTSTNTLPARYSSFTSLSTGHCAIHILNPTILDHHPWTVVAMVRGLDKEVSRVTDHSIDMPGSPGHPGHPGHPDEDEVQGGPRPGYMHIPLFCFWFGVAMFIIFFTTTSVLVIPKSRKWVLRKSSSIRHSNKRDSLEKPALPQYDEVAIPETNAALPA